MSAATTATTTTTKPAFPANKIVGICGGIAAGKSTFGKNFKKHAQFFWQQNGSVAQVLFEEEKVEQSLLSAYQKDPVKYGTHFQTVMVMAAAARQKHACTLREVHNPNALVLIERPIAENPIFADANVRAGNMDTGYKTDFYDHIVASLEGSTPDLFVFLHATDQTRNARLEERARPDEDLYGDEYLNILGDTYFEWAMEMASKRKLLVLNWNKYRKMDKVVRTVAEVLNGTRQLPQVTLIELSSSGESSEDGSAGSMLVKVGEESSPHFANTSDVKKRRKMQYKVLDALAEFKSVEVSF